MTAWFLWKTNYDAIFRNISPNFKIIALRALSYAQDINLWMIPVMTAKKFLISSCELVWLFLYCLCFLVFVFLFQFRKKFIIFYVIFFFNKNLGLLSPNK